MALTRPCPIVLSIVSQRWKWVNPKVVIAPHRCIKKYGDWVGNDRTKSPEYNNFGKGF
jgi:hypothetical protein